jgi:light-regulated signal transduction histidine kinase (bacteriophytochrome)
MNEELESFNYIASHDLKEPLRKIQTFTSRIIEKGEDLLPQDTIYYFDKIVSSASRMQLLIEDILMFSQTTANEKSFEKTDLNLVLQEVKIILSTSFEEKKATIEYNELPAIMAIPFQMQQLLLNLISNALKYGKESVAPYIKISSSVVDSSLLESSVLISNATSYNLISVEDNGIGFEEQYADKIFDLFTRLHEKNQYSGTGVGLAICKKIIYNHQGFITTQSSIGQGSVFNLYFPILSS